MIKHIVLCAFKKDLSEEAIAEILNSMHSLQKSIPQILSFSAGVNTSKEGLSKGFTHGFIMTFADEEAREIYIENEEHKRVAEQIVIPALQDGLNSVQVFDFND